MQGMSFAMRRRTEARFIEMLSNTMRFGHLADTSR